MGWPIFKQVSTGNKTRKVVPINLVYIYQGANRLKALSFASYFD